jgi:hypothetical protein
VPFASHRTQAVAVAEDGAAVRSDVIDVDMDMDAGGGVGDMATKHTIESRQAASHALSLMTEPLTDEQLAPLSIEMRDFEEALGMQTPLCIALGSDKEAWVMS